MSTTADLPDLNVWLALVWPEHSHHQHAVHYWEDQTSDRVLFSTVTALGLMRLVSQPKLMGPAVSNAAEASALLDALCQQPGVGLAEPEHGGWEVFHQLLLDTPVLLWAAITRSLSAPPPHGRSPRSGGWENCSTPDPSSTTTPWPWPVKPACGPYRTEILLIVC